MRIVLLRFNYLTRVFWLSREVTRASTKLPERVSFLRHDLTEFFKRCMMNEMTGRFQWESTKIIILLSFFIYFILFYFIYLFILNVEENG